MSNFFLKNLSILKKFLFINLVIFAVLGTSTIIYLKTVQPNLIKKKAANHIQIIENTIDHIQRLNIEFSRGNTKYSMILNRKIEKYFSRIIVKYEFRPEYCVEFFTIHIYIS